MPTRIRMTRARPWRVGHPDAVIVARPSRYGNPWRITPTTASPTNLGWTVQHAGDTVAEFDTRRAAAQWAIDQFTDCARDHLDLTALAGLDVACWCPLAEPCHGDAILTLANPDPPR